MEFFHLVISIYITYLHLSHKNWVQALNSNPKFIDFMIPCYHHSSTEGIRSGFRIFFGTYMFESCFIWKHFWYIIWVSDIYNGFIIFSRKVDNFVTLILNLLISNRFIASNLPYITLNVIPFLYAFPFFLLLA